MMLLSFGVTKDVIKIKIKICKHFKEKKEIVLYEMIIFFGCTNGRCEAFSTYPRTYDLIHAGDIFSDIEKKRCSAVDLLIEMDRILRPKGFIIVRDKQRIVDYIRSYLKALHWEVAAQESEKGEDVTVLIIQKKIWRTSESVRETE